jgi:hypothetical protein
MRSERFVPALVGVADRAGGGSQSWTCPPSELLRNGGNSAERLVKKLPPQ